MKYSARLTLLAFAAAAALSASPALGKFGDVVASFPAPAPKPTALAWGGGNLYCFCETAPFLFWKINPATGNAIGSFRFAKTAENTAGLTHDGKYFWAGNRVENRIYRFGWGGSTISSFKATWDVGLGLGWSGFHLWGTEESGTWSFYLYQIRPDGKVVRSYATYYKMYDLAWDGRYLWTPQYDEVAKVYYIVCLELSLGDTVAKFRAPADQARGMAYDGTYLWVSTMADNGRLWKIDIGGVGVEPSSLGRVRALFL
jgi:hypothetical protein